MKIIVIESAFVTFEMSGLKDRKQSSYYVLQKLPCNQQHTAH